MYDANIGVFHVGTESSRKQLRFEVTLGDESEVHHTGALIACQRLQADFVLKESTMLNIPESMLHELANSDGDLPDTFCVKCLGS